MLACIIHLLIGAGLALLLTPLARRLSTRGSGVQESDSDSRAIPLTGGIALFFATFPLLIYTSPSVPTGFWIGGSGMALIGFLDDRRPLTPIQKLCLQVLVAFTAAATGLRFEITGMLSMDSGITVLWFVWMCNAYNVLDMMDGLAAGVGGIAFAGFLALGSFAVLDGVIPVAAVFLGALFGFLFYNYEPARIYMGDTGSLFVGFVLAALTVVASNGIPGGRGVAGPALVLGIPSFEAVFTGFVRWRKGRSIVRASRDHVAHRLVGAGCSIRSAVGRLYLAGILAAVLGVSGILWEESGWLVIGLGFLLAGGFAARLARIETGTV